jgi:Flp pilus assembly protein TadD
VGQDIAQGAEALARGNYEEAIAAARRSLRIRPTSGGYFLLVKAYCGLRDLRNANAMLQNLPKGFRTQAIRYCKQKGLDLGG